MTDSATPPPSRGLAVKLRTARGRTTAQQKWLQRQLNDPYVRAAREQGYRSRAAFKLTELDDRFHLIRRGARVVDLGAAVVVELLQDVRQVAHRRQMDFLVQGAREAGVAQRLGDDDPLQRDRALAGDVGV